LAVNLAFPGHQIKRPSDKDKYSQFATRSGFGKLLISLYAVDESMPIDQFPLFFEDTRLNFAENMLCGDDDKVAIINIEEQNLWQPRKYTWKELRKLVTLYSSAFRHAGLRKGQVVTRTLLKPCHIIHHLQGALHTDFKKTVIGGNCIRSLALLLATASIGGLFASFATDIGEKVSPSCSLSDQHGETEIDR
jgi:acetoacetyl-CoA synthetase